MDETERLRRKVAHLEKRITKLTGKMKVRRELIPDWLSSGWYATLVNGRKVMVRTINTEKDGKRIVVCETENGFEYHCLTDFIPEAILLPAWMTKGSNVRTKYNGVAVITGVWRNKNTLVVTVRTNKGNTMWLSPRDIIGPCEKDTP